MEGEASHDDVYHKLLGRCVCLCDDRYNVCWNDSESLDQYIYSVYIIFYIYLYKGVLHYFESRVCMILRCSLITWIIQSVVHSPF